ncbi:MAG: glycosyltransferase family 9 protein [Oscillochloris sp.]|nr:glycosyltransferase family 9 protein [Oscillochloris sp.]
MSHTTILPPAWRAVRRILAVRLDNLGDLLLATPAIHAIRETLPNAQLSVLVSPIGAQAARLNPDINDVIVYRAPWVDPWQELAHDPMREDALITELRARRFDAAILFTSFCQSSLPAAYLCYLAGIPLRLGASIEGAGSLFTTRHCHPEALMHEVERGLDLVSAVGMYTTQRRLVLHVPLEARQQIEDWPAQHSAPSSPLIVMHPGYSMPARTYPVERFAQIADMVIAQLGARVVLTGAAEEAHLVARIGMQMRQHGIAAASALTFAELCALIESADLLITNNTGPMHIAAALGTPVVALFALTNLPEQWRPWQVPHRILFQDTPCQICYNQVCTADHRCLLGIMPEVVVEATANLLIEQTNRHIRSLEVGPT